MNNRLTPPKSAEFHSSGKIPLLSFFTGGGFLDMGFEQGGFEVVWTNENNRSFARLYSAGYSSWRTTTKTGSEVSITNTSSVESLTARDILNQAFNGKRPQIFGVIAGPPCQDFSSGGKNRGSRGKRGRLTKVFVDLLCNIRPDFFVMENVAGLHRFKKHKRLLERLEAKLKPHFEIDQKVLNAIELGVPQHRERFFLVGISRKLIKNSRNGSVQNPNGSWFPWPKGKYRNALTRYNWPKVGKFGDKPVEPKGIPRKLFVINYLLPENDLSKTPNANDMFNAHSRKFHKIPEGDTSGKSFKRLHRYRFSPTACYGNNEVHLHPWKPRRLSLREVMRIQGIPEEYVLPEDGFLTQKFKMVGNGVPVPVAKAVAVAFRKHLAELYNGHSLNGHLVKKKKK
jgi:DNA (cytosine-5)-methyltransferase 1